MDVDPARDRGSDLLKNLSFSHTGAMTGVVRVKWMNAILLLLLVAVWLPSSSHALTHG